MTACYCGNDGPTPLFYVQTTRTARRKHTCYECACPIQPGEQYEDLRANWGDGPVTIRTCQDCITVRDAIASMPCFYWKHGSLIDDIYDQFRETYFQPALRFNLLRLVAQHRYRKRMNKYRRRTA